MLKNDPKIWAERDLAAGFDYWKMAIVDLLKDGIRTQQKNRYIELDPTSFSLII